jgi:hypothetical protein
VSAEAATHPLGAAFAGLVIGALAAIPSTCCSPTCAGPGRSSRPRPAPSPPGPPWPRAGRSPCLPAGPAPPDGPTCASAATASRVAMPAAAPARRSASATPWPGGGRSASSAPGGWSKTTASCSARAERGSRSACASVGPPAATDCCSGLGLGQVERPALGGQPAHGDGLWGGVGRHEGRPHARAAAPDRGRGSASSPTSGRSTAAIAGTRSGGATARS